MSLKQVSETVGRHDYRPPEKITTWQWADRNRIISSGNAEQGKWKTARVPYQIGLMEAVTDPKIQKITAMMGAQTGKTDSLILNSIGYFIDNDPSNIIVMQPTETDMQTFQSTKLDPMIRDTKVLRDKVAKPRARTGVNNTKVKSFTGGFIFFAHSGSPNTMRGRSAGKVLMDEVDGYEMTPEGHPCLLLEKRAKTFQDKLIIITSTPTTETRSYVNRSFESGDKRRYWVPCPKCKTFQILIFAQVKWEKDKNGIADPGSARYECPECAYRITDGEKVRMLGKGEWRAEKPCTGHASFHLPSLYSPFVTWENVASDYLEALSQGDVGSYINTVLAEVTKDVSESVSHQRLFERRESYPLNRVPKGGLFLTAAVDVQGDRLECEIRAWGRDQESWSIDYRVCPGDPSNPRDGCYRELDRILEENWPLESGAELQIKRMAIDVGYLTPSVTKWARTYNATGRVICVMGYQKGAQIINQTRESDLNHRGRKIRHGTKIWMVGTDVAKAELFKRLDLDVPEDGKKYPFGYLHFPMYDMNYFKMLTAEKLVKKINRRGYEEEEWTKIRARNEALDLAVYNRAAASSLGIDRYRDDRWEALEKAACMKAVDRKPERKKEEWEMKRDEYWKRYKRGDPYRPPEPVSPRRKKKRENSCWKEQRMSSIWDQNRDRKKLQRLLGAR